MEQLHTIQQGVLHTFSVGLQAMQGPTFNGQNGSTTNPLEILPTGARPINFSTQPDNGSLSQNSNPVLQDLTHTNSSSAPKTIAPPPPPDIPPPAPDIFVPPQPLILHVNGNPVIQPLQVPDPGPINAPAGIPGSTLTLANNFAFSDADVTDTHTVTSQFNAAASGVAVPLGTFVATEQNDTVNGNGGLTHWEYQVAADAVNALPHDTVRHEVFDVIVADDQGGTATHQVAITIDGPPNNPPVIQNVGGTVPVAEDSSVLLAAPSALVTDADGDTLTMTLHVGHGTLAPSAAILAAIANNTLTAVNSDGSDGTLSVSGSASAITAAIQAGITYAPTHDFNGGDALDVAISDGHGGTTQASVIITVNPVNDAPVATGSATLAAINEDAAAPTGATVSSLFGGNFSDVADQVTGGSSSNSFAGIAISSYTVDASKGAWQYSSNSGGSWTALGSATTTAALTLNTTDLLRFVPAANYNGSATALSANLIESGQAISSGATLNLTGATGGTTHISLATVALSESINPVNDAPVATGSATLAAINEDAAAPTGATVSSLFGGNFSDVADQVTGGSSSNSFAGIAISSYTVDASKGAWQYSSNSGGSWTALGSATTTAALTLNTTDLLRFVPAANYNGSATALSANLIESGQAISSGATLNLTGATGGTTHISLATVALSESINPVNDAPVIDLLSAVGVQVTATTASFTENGGAITIAPQLTLSDVDSLTLAGATVTLTDAQTGDVLSLQGQAGASGTLASGIAFSISGSSVTFSNVSSSANYQAALHLVQFDNTIVNPSTTARTFSFQVDDGGGANNTASATATVTIGAVNHAPQVTVPSPSAAVNEDGSLNLTGATVTDVDSGDVLTATINVVHGTLTSLATALQLAQLTSATGNGSGLLTITGSASAVNAVVTAGVTYTPAANYNGQDPLNLSVSDSLNASDSKQVIITINPVNDAPVATGSATLAAINEDAAAPTGATVSSLFGGNFSDVADQVTGGSSSNSFAGIAISSYTVDASKGAWQYSSNSGGSWTALGSATTTAALTLNTTDLLRFVPAANYNGSATALSANLIESGQAISSGATLNLTGATGGTTHISLATVALSESINPVNDAPVATGSATLAAINEDAAAPTGATVSSLFGGNFSDVADQVTGGSSSNSFAGIAISSYTVDASKGAWQYSSNSGGSWTALGSATTTAALTLNTTDLLRFVPAANYNGSATALSANLIESGQAISSGATLNLTGVLVRLRCQRAGQFLQLDRRVRCASRGRGRRGALELNRRRLVRSDGRERQMPSPLNKSLLAGQPAAGAASCVRPPARTRRAPTRTAGGRKFDPPARVDHGDARPVQRARAHPGLLDRWQRGASPPAESARPWSVAAACASGAAPVPGGQQEPAVAGQAAGCRPAGSPWRSRVRRTGYRRPRDVLPTSRGRGNESPSACLNI